MWHLTAFMYAKGINLKDRQLINERLSYLPKCQRCVFIKCQPSNNNFDISSARDAGSSPCHSAFPPSSLSMHSRRLPTPVQLPNPLPPHTPVYLLLLLLPNLPLYTRKLFSNLVRRALQPRGTQKHAVGPQFRRECPSAMRLRKKE